MPRSNRGEKGKPIAGVPANRDPNSGAVVFNDPAGYQRRIKAKRQGKNMLMQQRKLDVQEDRLNKLEKKLEKLIDDVGGGNPGNPGGGNPNNP